MSDQIDDDMTELVDADVSRMDLVDKSANGTKFLMMIADHGRGTLFTDDQVERLIKSAEADEVRGTPTAGASLTTSGGTNDPDTLKSAMPESGATDMSEKTDVAKDAEDVLEEPGAGQPTLNAEVPGSPAWEAIDAATAQAQYGVLARVKLALKTLSDREDIEVVSGNGDDGDAMNAFDLDDAACTLDWVMDLLAAYGASEQSSVDLSDDMQKAITTAVDEISVSDVFKIETTNVIMKAGRTLSSANETSLRNAVESILKVLSSLPAAPDDTVTKKEETTVARELPKAFLDTLSTEQIEILRKGGSLSDAPTEEQPETDAVAKAEPEAEVVEKADATDADGDATKLQAVFDSNGNLVGVTDPANIQPISGAGASAADDDNDGTPDGAEGAATDDLTPEPSADAGTVVGKKEAPTELAVLVKAAVEESRAEDRATIDELRKTVEQLQEPAPKAVTKGITQVPAVSLRGQTDGSDDVTVTKQTADDLRKASAEATSAVEKQKIDNERMALAIDVLGKSRVPVPARH